MKNHRTNVEIPILAVEDDDRTNYFDFERHKTHRLIVNKTTDIRVGDVLSNTTDNTTIYAQVYKTVNLSAHNADAPSNYVYVDILDDNLKIMEAIEDSKR